MEHRKQIVRFALSRGHRENYHDVLKASFAKFSQRGISYQSVRSTLNTVYELKGWRENLPSVIDVQMTKSDRTTEASAHKVPFKFYTHVRDRALMTGKRVNDLETELVKLKKKQNIIKKMGLPCSHDGTEKL